LRADVRDELVRHLVERKLGDLELVLGDQRQQQVERAFEAVQPNGEPCDLRRGLAGGLGGCCHALAASRASTSPARRRYASAAELPGANEVIGSPATAASGNFTVRWIAVPKTRSPKPCLTVASTSRLCSVLGSYIVGRTPTTSRCGLVRLFTLPIVS